jgi:hypothetical protein
MCDKQSLAKGLLACIVVLLACIQYTSSQPLADVVSEGANDHEINQLVMKKMASIKMLREALKLETNSLNLLLSAPNNEEADDVNDQQHDDFSRSLDRNKKNALKRGMMKAVALGFGK